LLSGLHGFSLEELAVAAILAKHIAKLISSGWIYTTPYCYWPNEVGGTNRPKHSDRDEAAHEALEGVREEEIKRALKVMEETSRKVKPGKPVAEIIRGFRDRR